MAYRYHPGYCEENAWHLCGEPALANAQPHVAIVSNAERCVVMWEQRAADRDAPIAWDYHVFVVACTDGWQVWDFDTCVGLPVGLSRYVTATFAGVGRQPSQLDPRFRLVSATDYRDILRSDRSHMRRADGSWHAPPPPWPPISAPEEGTNLERFIDIRADGPGHVVDVQGLIARFARPR